MKFLLTLSFFFLLAAAQNQNKVAFTAFFSAGGDIGIDNRYPIRFDQLTANVGNGYNTMTGVFTAPVSGVYLFILSAKASSRFSDPISLAIYKSGIPVMWIDVLGYYQTYMDQASGFATLELNAGDSVYVKFSASYQSPPYVIDKWCETSFTGILL